MLFLWPAALVSLVIVPLLVAWYVWLQRRRRRYPVVYASLSLLRDAVPKRSHWRRHLPFALLLAAMASLMVAMSRPQAVVEVPLSRTSIILAIDVSRSMCSTDVEPNRLAVAQDAARAFVDDQADGTRIGIVAFGGLAELVVPPTTDKEELTRAIDGFTTSLGTVIGNATLKSLDAIAQVNPAVAPSTINLSGDNLGGDEGDGPDATGLDGAATDGTGLGGDAQEFGEEPYVPDIVVLLTDGANSRGVDPIIAAQQAAERRVRVYTIGFGTEEPVAMICTQEQIGGEAFNERFGLSNDGGFGVSFRQYLVIDEPTLQAIADLTGGQYYRAEDADQLSTVFAELPTQIELQEQEQELSVAFVLAGAILALVAVGLSLRWNRT